jgi:hypothetical protein
MLNTAPLPPTHADAHPLPPTPIVPTIVYPPFEPHVRSVEADPATLKPGVIDDLAAIAHTWGLTASPSSSPALPLAGFDVLGALTRTTRGVRAVRNYVLALPGDEAAALRDGFQFRSRVTASAPAVKRRVSRDALTREKDPLALVRRAALDVLAVLRELEEKARLPLADEAYEASSDHEAGSQGVASPAMHPMEMSLSLSEEPAEYGADGDFDPDMSFSLVKVKGRDEHVPVWEDDTHEINSTLSPEEREKREGWEDRLVVGGGWLYKQDIRMEELEKEKEAVAKYLDDVDDVLFGGSKDGERGWERERRKIEMERQREARRGGRRASAGDEVFAFPTAKKQGGGGSRRVVSVGMVDAMREMTVAEEPGQMEDGGSGGSLGSLVEEEEGEVDDEELPDWAKRSTFHDDPLGAFFLDERRGRL